MHSVRSHPEDTGPPLRLVTGLARLARAANAGLGLDDLVRELCAVAVDVLGADAARLVPAGTPDATGGGDPAGRAGAAGGPGGPVPIEVLPGSAGRRGPTVRVPLIARNRTWGALEVVGRVGTGWDDGARSVAALLADMAASAVALSAAGPPAPADASGGLVPDLRRELDGALAAGQLRVHYQPIVVAAPTGGAAGGGAAAGHPLAAVEALLRWQHPRYGLLTAGDFVALAEQSGAIGPIGRWVVETTCAQLEAWRAWRPGPLRPRAFVNLSPGELSDPALPAAVAASTAAHGVAAGDLVLEVVEGDLADPRQLAALADHHARGHPLAVDDFGTGWSSLARLVDLPVSFVKIDGSLVRGLPFDARRRQFVDAVVVIAHHLGIDVVAEGVEDEGQAAALAAAGCDLLQGNHVGRAVPGDELNARWAGVAAPGPVAAGRPARELVTGAA